MQGSSTCLQTHSVAENFDRLFQGRWLLPTTLPPQQHFQAVFMALISFHNITISVCRNFSSSLCENTRARARACVCGALFHLVNLIIWVAAAVAEQNKKEFNTPPVVVSSRWNPTPEQLRVLEELYRRGTRTPSADQIQHITSQLRRYGKIEGKNVFYWFQNHKARERQKRRRQMESASDTEILERKELGKNPSRIYIVYFLFFLSFFFYLSYILL